MPWQTLASKRTRHPSPLRPVHRSFTSRCLLTENHRDECQHSEDRDEAGDYTCPRARHIRTFLSQRPHILPMFVGTKDERQQPRAHHYHGESSRPDQAIVLPPSPQFKLKELVDAKTESD